MKKAVLSISILFLCVFSIAQLPEYHDYLAIPGNTPGGNSSGQARDIIRIGTDESLGGYVFYVTPDGQHGLVAATQDQSASSDWYSAQDVISNPDSHNTVGKKFMDWRLPTRFELNLMYTQKDAIGAFVNKYYWSSIMNGNTYAWLLNFDNGGQDYGPKDGVYHVRAVRAF